MIVKELLSKFKAEDVLERLLEIRPYILEFMNEKEQILFKTVAKKAYGNILSTEPSINKEEVLVCAKQVASFVDADDEYDISSFKIDESKDGIYFFDEEHCVNRYAIIFSPWEDILGMDVCQLSLDLYGEELISSLIFHELIRMGFSNESRKSYIEKEVNILKERAESIKEEECIPAEDVFKSIAEDIANDLENEGNFEEAEEWREWGDPENFKTTEEEKEYMHNSIITNQNLLFKFKRYISENY